MPCNPAGDGKRRKSGYCALPIHNKTGDERHEENEPSAFPGRRVAGGAGTRRLCVHFAGHPHAHAPRLILHRARPREARRSAGRPLGRAAPVRRHALRRLRGAGLHRRARPALADGPVAQARPRRDGEGLRPRLGRERPRRARRALPRRHVPRMAGLRLRRQARGRGLHGRRQRLRGAGARAARAAAHRVRAAGLPAGHVVARGRGAHPAPRAHAQLHVGGRPRTRLLRRRAGRQGRLAAPRTRSAGHAEGARGLRSLQPSGGGAARGLPAGDRCAALHQGEHARGHERGRVFRAGRAAAGQCGGDRREGRAGRGGAG
ncbi:hypothetical protein D9M68_587970 [compost metagenome]